MYGDCKGWFLGLNARENEPSTSGRWIPPAREADVPDENGMVRRHKGVMDES